MSNSSGFFWSRTYEQQRNLIASVENCFNEDLISQFDYTNDEIGRRMQRIDDFAVTNAFRYNHRSELIEAVMNTNAFGYLYDDIGNRAWAQQNAATNLYLVNALIQYTNIADVMIVEPEYDADGNMIATGNGWRYVWNAENRLILASNDMTVVTYAYDHQGRMVAKTVNGAARHYLWDGYNIVRETIHNPQSTITNQYVWGLDLSSSLQSAGGIGGLLAEVRDGEPYFAASDANGNVTEYLSADGTITAHYEYSPFGEIVVQSGDLAGSFSHRFSTKPWCATTGLSEYEMRKHSLKLGRWLSRDPIGEQGGMNVYAFVKNTPVVSFDKLGLVCWSKKLNSQSPNPSGASDGKLGFTIWIRYDFAYHPADSTQVWLVNAREGYRMEQIGNRCYGGDFTLDPVIDVNDILEGNPWTVDRQELSELFADYCYYELNITSTHGFSPKREERPTGGNQPSDPGTYALMLSAMSSPLDVTTIRYVFSNPAKCCACIDKLPIKFKHESLSVSEIGWWGTSFSNIVTY